MSVQIRFLLLACFLLGGTASAADFSFDGEKGRALVLNGEIQPGDAEKLQEVIRNQPVEFMRASSLSLNSQGGSVTEALKLASIIEKSGLMARVNSGSTCASACFLLYVSSQFRSSDSDGNILIHRPYLTKVRTDIKGYNTDRNSQQKSLAEMRAFMEERAVPSSLIDKMLNYPSNGAHRVTAQELFEEVRHLSPTLEELTIKECGLSNRNIFSEERDFGGNPGQDDLSCIRKFTMPLRWDYTRAVLGDVRFRQAWALFREITND